MATIYIITCFSINSASFGMLDFIVILWKIQSSTKCFAYLEKIEKKVNKIWIQKKVREELYVRL